MGQGAAIIIATDNDAGGRELAGQIAAIADESGRADLQIVQDLPEGEGRGGTGMMLFERLRTRNKCRMRNFLVRPLRVGR